MKSLKARIRRGGLRRDESGSAAVEFALVVPIFLVFMYSFFEIGWFYFTNSVLDASTSDAARLVKTGQVQGWTGSDDEVKERLFQEVCDTLRLWGDCNTRVTVEIQTFPSFAAMSPATPPTCADAPPSNLAALPFQPGGELEIVRVRICLIYETINPLIGDGFKQYGLSGGIELSEGDTGKRRLISTLMFRNEPYERNVFN